MKILYLPHEFSQQRQKEKKRWIYPVLLAMQAQHYRNLGHEVIWDQYCVDSDKIIKEPEYINHTQLPAPDRIFTNAFDKKYQSNGNFKYLPATYIQAAGGCWHGRCTFCVERKNKYEVRPVWDVIQEIKKCHELGFKEVFDDSATFPVGKWLDQFLSEMERINHVNRPVMGCNMRLCDMDYRRLADCGFRMLLFGLESANQETLDRINKGVKIEEAIKVLKKASEAGLEPHVAVMFGYPWETDADAERTLRLVHHLLTSGTVKTAQASFYDVCGESGQAHQRKFVKRIYEAAWSPQFWFNKLKDVKNKDDIRYLWRQIKEGLNDFSYRR